MKINTKGNLSLTEVVGSILLLAVSKSLVHSPGSLVHVQESLVHLEVHLAACPSVESVALSLPGPISRV